MYRLTLRIGESVRLGSGPGSVLLTVLEASGPRVRLGVAAPAEAPVWRQELWFPGRPSMAARGEKRAES